MRAIRDTFEQLMSRFAPSTPAEDLPSAFVDLLGAAAGLLPPQSSATGTISPVDIVPEDLDVAIGNFVNEVHESLMNMLYEKERLLGIYIPVIEDEQPIYDTQGNVTYDEDGALEQHFDEKGKMYRTQWEEEITG
jgi:hypothetical protein